MGEKSKNIESMKLHGICVAVTFSQVGGKELGQGSMVKKHWLYEQFFLKLFLKFKAFKIGNFNF